MSLANQEKETSEQTIESAQIPQKSPDTEQPLPPSTPAPSDQKTAVLNTGEVKLKAKSQHEQTSLQQLISESRLGKADAQLELGIRYQLGIGVAKDGKIAARLYGLAAKQGNTAAQYHLGQCYAEGIGVEKDKKAAAHFYRLAVAKGEVRAQRDLGYCYTWGEGVEKDKKEAVRLYRLAAEQGDILSEISLGYCYLEGVGVDKDVEEAVRIFKRRADQEEISAQYALGLCYEKGAGVEKDVKEALRLYRLTADKGYALSIIAMGLCYLHGVGVEKDATEAVRHFKLQVAQGHAVAQYHLGYCYEQGTGVEKDINETVRLYRLAAHQGNTDALVRLGYCYKRGAGVKKDVKEAVRLYQLGVNQGSAAAKTFLSFCYQEGIGVEKDVKEAVRLKNMAAEQGFIGAKVSLGQCYEEGIGVEQDLKKAVRLYSLAAEQGDANGQINLGICYQEGRGVAKDEKEAVRLYKLSAEQGDASGQYFLGRLHQKGGIVPKDDKEALRLIRLAADQGEAIAQANLGFRYDRGYGVIKDEQQAADFLRLAADQGHPESQYLLGTYYQEGRGGIKKNEQEAARLYRLSAAQGNAKAPSKLQPLEAKLAFTTKNSNTLQALDVKKHDVRYRHKEKQGNEKFLFNALSNKCFAEMILILAGMAEFLRMREVNYYYYKRMDELFKEQLKIFAKILMRGNLISLSLDHEVLGVFALSRPLEFKISPKDQFKIALCHGLDIDEFKGSIDKYLHNLLSEDPDLAVVVASHPDLRKRIAKRADSTSSGTNLAWNTIISQQPEVARLAFKMADQGDELGIYNLSKAELLDLAANNFSKEILKRFPNFIHLEKTDLSHIKHQTKRIPRPVKESQISSHIISRSLRYRGTPDITKENFLELTSIDMQNRVLAAIYKIIQQNVAIQRQLNVDAKQALKFVWDHANMREWITTHLTPEQNKQMLAIVIKDIENHALRSEVSVNKKVIAYLTDIDSKLKKSPAESKLPAIGDNSAGIFYHADTPGIKPALSAGVIFTKDAARKKLKSLHGDFATCALLCPHSTEQSTLHLMLARPQQNPVHYNLTYLSSSQWIAWQPKIPVDKKLISYRPSPLNRDDIHTEAAQAKLQVFLTDELPKLATKHQFSAPVLIQPTETEDYFKSKIAETQAGPNNHPG